ncbi:MAG: hypothetical protein HC876_06535 [Chloroflexaceae bacterium]|nr:hypothetical protein [Chloroflexaceae bacterium]NJO05196.1 hypothetical protein [Chloroflexaceae bacterium]
MDISSFRLLRRGSLLLALLVLVGSLLAVAPAAAQSNTRDADREADVAVTLEAIPNVYVARGTILAYKLRVENYAGNGTMDYARVWLPYNPGQMTLVDAYFETDTDYVESIEGDQINLFFGVLGKRAARFAVLYMYVNETLPVGTLLDMWAGYSWEDQHGNFELDSRSNAAPVIVNDFNEASNYVWMAIEPREAASGTPIGLFTNRLMPGERVRLYVVGPAGNRVQLDSDNIEVGPQGQLWLTFESAGFPPGTYSYIVEGRRSRLQASADFTLLPPPAEGQQP